MKPNFADRLSNAIDRARMPGVVALDPVFERLPAVLRAGVKPGDKNGELSAITTFCRESLPIFANHLPAVKINSAYFERYRGSGVAAYHALVAESRRQGLLTIGDVKRGDVGHTADQYAAAHITHCADSRVDDGIPDAITISGYFGWDGVKPFSEAALAGGRGLFVLVRTSNESAATVQDIVTQDGRKVHEVVAELVAKWAADSAAIGSSGYSSIGAVVATRNAKDAARLRELMPKSIFLVPGYGAQGGTAESLRPYFKADGGGAIIAAGRSVIFAHDVKAYAGRFGDDWMACVDAACGDFKSDIQRVWPGASRV